MTLSIGLDFGTTNTVATTMNADGQSDTIKYAHGGETLDSLRSVLCFWQTHDEDVLRTKVEAGPWAIEEFLELAGECHCATGL
jgi:hypothetical chaperone protein